MIIAKIAFTILLFVALGLALLMVWQSPSPKAAADRPETPRCVPPAVSIGMTKSALLAACGSPSSVSHQLLDGGKLDKEQWAYLDSGSYVYLSNGIVDGIQYAENGERFSWKN